MSSRPHYGARLLCLSLILALLLVTIGVLRAPRAAQAQATPAVTPSPLPLSEFGRIGTEVRQVRRPNCWTLVVRGRLHNPYDEPVDGVRLIVRLRGAGDTPRELERIEKELQIEIGPAGSASFNRQLTTGCTSMYNDISVIAFANRRGGKELPIPAREAEIEASQVQQAFTGPGNVPIVNSPVVPNLGSLR